MSVDTSELVFVNPRRRPSNVELTERLARARSINSSLRLELRTVNAERVALGSDLAALSNRIQLAIRADRPDLAMEVAFRLSVFAASQTRKGSA